MGTLESWTQEPTLRTGHRTEWKGETYSYFLAAAEGSKGDRQVQRRLACCAMEWAFRVLPHDARVCDAHLVLAPRSYDAPLSRRARELGLELFPHVRSEGVAILSSMSEKLVDFLFQEAGNDDDLYLRPLGRADVPDVQSWMVRDQRAYVENAPERYGAVLLFCLKPVSFEIVSVSPMAELARDTAQKLAEERGILLQAGPPFKDTNWPGWGAWFRSLLGVRGASSPR